MLRRFYHADPWEWTVEQWHGALNAMNEISEMETGTTSHRAKAERMRRQKERRDTWLILS
jgi:hypothetical protein